MTNGLLYRLFERLGGVSEAFRLFIQSLLKRVTAKIKRVVIPLWTTKLTWKENNRIIISKKIKKKKKNYLRECCYKSIVKVGVEWPVHYKPYRLHQTKNCQDFSDIAVDWYAGNKRTEGWVGAGSKRTYNSSQNC